MHYYCQCCGDILGTAVVNDEQENLTEQEDPAIIDNHVSQSEVYVEAMCEDCSSTLSGGQSQISSWASSSFYRH